LRRVPPQFLGPLVKLGDEVNLRLFEPGQLALEFSDIGWGAEPGGVSDLLAEQLGEPGLRLPDPGGKRWLRPARWPGRLARHS
jgi:hypothetical protein